MPTLTENHLLQFAGGNPDPPGQLLEENANTAITDAGQLTLAGALLSTINAGVANTGVTALEYGNGMIHLTHLTIAQADALTAADAAAIADGYLLYTFPAGNILILGAMMDIALTANSPQQVADMPDMGLGTVIGTGAVATLNLVGAGAGEDIITGAAAADCNGTYNERGAGPTAAVPFFINSAAAHTVHLNVADTWANDTSTDLDIDLAGTVALAWMFLA